MRLLRVALMLGLLSSCGESTPGTRFTIPFSAAGIDRDAEQPLTFTTPEGWTVTLKTAKIALGPFYFSEPIQEQTSANDLSRIVRTNAEVTRQIVVDVLDPTPKDVPGGVDGRSGTSVLVDIGLLPPDDHASDEDLNLLKLGFAYLAGTATKNGTTVKFAGRMVIDQSMATPQEPLEQKRKVKGAVVGLEFTGDGQQLVLRVDPAPWFEHTDFAGLTDQDANGTFTWVKNSTFHAQLLGSVVGQKGIYNFALIDRRESPSKQ